MANMEIEGNSNPKMVKATGTGINSDPFIVEFSLPIAQINQLITSLGGAV